jgi:hypothetical protein
MQIPAGLADALILSRSESDANADLAAPLDDGMYDDAVDPCHRNWH